MAAKRAERLVNLVIALLSTRQYVTAAPIRATVPGYEPDDGTDRADEAFKRMFERDKAELREMGVPLETGRTSVFDTEDGYRIARADYELPEIRLTGEEAAAVGLALRLWESAQLAGAAQSALVKLKAAGVDVDSSRAHPAAAAAGRRRARLRALLRRRPRPPGARVRLPASRRGRARPAGGCSRGASSPGTAAGTSVGLDLDRGAARVFRLSRVVGTPKADRPGRRLRAAGRPRPRRDGRRPGRGRGARSSSSAPAPARAIGLRRHATSLGPADDGDDRLQLRTTEPWSLADQLAAYGADVVVESPAEVREAVIAAAHPPGRDGGAGMTAGGTTDRMTRLLALVPYLTARPDGRRRGRGRPRLRRHRAAAAQRPRAALDVRPARATAPATSSTWPSRATGCGSPSPPAWSGRCG